MTYQAPVDDIMLSLKSAGRLEEMVAAGHLDGLDQETVRAIVEEAGKFASDVLDPLNRPGDLAGAQLSDGKVATPEGWQQAYDQFVEGGWAALPGPARYGGQGLPETVAMAACEIWNAANLSFGLCPLLTQGAIGALLATGSDELKEKYLPNMIAGAWTGTMNLTEPHAGSDLSLLKTTATPQDDGTYRLRGTKIYISYGEHELTENIIHFVLARLPDAPQGTRGISLFLVPKMMVNDDGSLGARNDVICAGLEHKMGIHAAPTCTMKYGENDGAVGYLVGEVNRGLNAMFIMMNAARLAVGVQGVSLADRATQRATAYAVERTQGKTPGTAKDAPVDQMVPIIEHADIRRTLVTMKAMTQAARTICFATAAAMDRAHGETDDAARQAADQEAALLTPIAKAFSTDIGCEVASMGVQVHGGMGFVEETGAAQYFRDARILPIYEGTNGIQAIDLVTRKLTMGGGAVLRAYLDDCATTVDDVRASNLPGFGRTADRLASAIAATRDSAAWLLETLPGETDAALAGATPFLRLFGLTAGTHYLARAALAASHMGHDQHEAITLARVFAETQASAAEGLQTTIMEGAEGVLQLSPQALAS
ncbi:MAG: acyl-CoA dehydrogenase [Pseudomonadota bacterium]